MKPRRVAFVECPLCPIFPMAVPVEFTIGPRGKVKVTFDSRFIHDHVAAHQDSPRPASAESSAIQDAPGEGPRRRSALGYRWSNG